MKQAIQLYARSFFKTRTLPCAVSTSYPCAIASCDYAADFFHAIYQLPCACSLMRPFFRAPAAYRAINKGYMFKRNPRFNHIRCPKHEGFANCGTCHNCVLCQQCAEILYHLQIDTWANLHIFTLTCKQSLPVPGHDWHQPITDIEASKSFKRWRNKMNRDLLPRSITRNGGCIGTFAVQEYDRDGIAPTPLGRLHFHGIIECPDTAMVDELPELAALRWRQTHWGYNETKIEPYKGEEWFFYFMKQRTKRDLFSCIEPEGWRLPTWSRPVP